MRVQPTNAVDFFPAGSNFMSKTMIGAAPLASRRGPPRDWARDLAPLGERRLKVVWDISNKCNLRCKMCHFAVDEVFHRPAKYMTVEEFCRLSEKVLPYAHTLILSAGAEPLTSPYFGEILKVAATYRVPDLLFITNGLRLTRDLVDLVIECGVTQIQFSVDGSTPATYESVRRGGKLERLIENIRYLDARKKALVSATPRLQFNIVLMKSNIEELDGFVDLAEELGVEWIAARHLLVMNGLDCERESLSLDPERANFYFERFLQRAEGSRSVQVIGFPDLFDVEALRAAPGGTRLASRARPFGYLDEPAEDAIATNSEAKFSGWAIDSEMLTGVCIEREPFGGEDADDLNEFGRVHVADAEMGSARPDVAALFEDYPGAALSGWSAIVNCDPLFDTLNEIVFHVVAYSLERPPTDLGQRRIRREKEQSVA